MEDETNENGPIQIQDDVYKQILPLVIKYMNVKELLKACNTCKLWNEVIKGSSSDMWKFKVCMDPLSVDAFKNISPSFGIKHFQFENMDLEGKIFGNPEAFRRFSLGHCRTMESLGIRNCHLTTGRFLELLAFCKSLKKLTIRSCPSIFRVDERIGILHWGFCFNHIRENMSKVKFLSVVDTSSYVLSDKDILGLAKGMNNLCLLHVGVGELNRVLPIRGTNEVLKVCSKTLESLNLRGRIQHPGFDIGTEIEMESLKRLVLLKSKIRYAGSEHLEKFLQKCPKLEELKLQDCYLNENALSNLPFIKGFKHLELIHCDLGGGNFEDSQFENLRTLKLFNSSETISEPSIYECAAASLLKCAKPELKALELQLSFDGASNYLKYLDVAQCPKLSSLSLTSCIDIAGIHLRKIFKDFQSLVSLSMKNCTDICDENLCPTTDENAPYLADLKSLKLLSLNGTEVGNRTVFECILRMGTLVDINLSNTKVDEEGIRAIIKSVQHSLPSLKAVSVSMKTCIFSTEEYAEMCRVAQSVNISIC